MKKMMLYGIIGLFVGLILSACGGGGSAPVVYSKAEVKAYLFCTMSSNSKIISVESTIKVPGGLEVAYSTPAIGDSLTIFNLKPDFISAPLFSNNGSVSVSGVSGTFDTDTLNRSIKYTLFNPPATIKSHTNNKGLEIATFTLPFTKTGVSPTSQFPDSDTSPIIGGADIITGIPVYPAGCLVNYVTIYK